MWYETKTQALNWTLWPSKQCIWCICCWAKMKRVKQRKWAWNKTISLRYEVIKTRCCCTKWTHSYPGSEIGLLASLNHLNLTAFPTKQEKRSLRIQCSCREKIKTQPANFKEMTRKCSVSIYKLLRDETFPPTLVGHQTGRIASSPEVVVTTATCLCEEQQWRVQNRNTVCTVITQPANTHKMFLFCRRSHRTWMSEGMEASGSSSTDSHSVLCCCCVSVQCL